MFCLLEELQIIALKINQQGINFLAVQWLGLHTHSLGSGFNPWLGNLDPTSCWGWQKKKKKSAKSTKMHCPACDFKRDVHYVHISSKSSVERMIKKCHFVLGSERFCYFLEGVWFILVYFLWLVSSMIIGIENELNNLEIIVKIIKRRHFLYSDIINTPLGVVSSVSLDWTRNLRDFLKCLTKICPGICIFLCVIQVSNIKAK